MYSYSSNDEDSFRGSYPTVEAACDAAAKDYGVGCHFYVGENTPPPSPESYWEPWDWLEHVGVQDEYGGDWAANWDGSTKEQQDELRELVRIVMADWLDRYDLRPKFWNVEKVRKFYVAGEQDGLYEIEALS